MTKTYLSNLEAKLRSQAIDRRQFMQGALATGMAVSTATLVADGVEAATPNSGGHIKFGRGHGSTTDSLDPATSENGAQIQLNFSYANCLTEVAQDGTLIPELAESIEPSADAKTWVFNLRKDVEFHNGKTLKSEDVIASFNHHRGENSKSAAKGLLEQVVELKTDGDNRVVFELTSGNADFSYITSDYHLLILPSKDGQVDPLAGVGTGGYRIEKYDPGVKAELTRNANYWKAGKAHFDSVEIISLLDATARQSASINGEVDVIDRVDPKTVNLLSRAPNLNILETTGTLHYTFPMRLDTTPFDNYDLRMALKLSLKRQELLDKILFGHGVLGNDHPISTANRYHASNIPQREYDPEKAAFHYKKSGHSGRIPLSASDAAFAGAVDAAQLIAASAKEAGIDIEIVREPKDGYWSNVWNKKGWCACYWGGRPTEDWMFSSAYVDSTEWNDTAWKDTDAARKFNRIVIEARSELDENKRRELYAEAQFLLNDDGGAIVAAFANYIHALSNKVAHGKDVAANWDMDGAKAQERWWFA